MTGLDISETLLTIARQNAAREGVEVDFRHGDVAAMPFERESFDFIVCQAAFQNFSRPMEALKEMRRVLKAGGKAVIVDLRHYASSRAINDYVATISGSVVNWLTNQLLYRLILVRRAYSAEQLEKLLATSEFAEFKIQEYPMTREIWAAKSAD